MSRPINCIVVGALTLAVSLSTAAQQVLKKDGSLAQQQIVERPITQLIVKYRDDTVQTFSATEGRRKAASLAGKSNVALRYRRQMSGMAHVLTLPQPMSRAEAIALSKRLEMDSNVAYAEPDEWMYEALTPNDSLYLTHQWHYFAPSTTTGNAGGINAPTAWDVNRGQGVIVAVIDTGVASHPDLVANVLNGYDFISDVNSANDSDGRDADASDPGNWRSATDCPAAPTQRPSNWHGTHVAGTVAAVTNNFSGVAGVAYEARILPLRALGRCGGQISDIAEAIRWAAGLPVIGVPNNPNIAHIINMSLGSAAAGACSVTYASAISAARSAGVTIVAAAGNDSEPAIRSPANCAGVVSVTAHTYQGDNADYANVGPGTSISAPGGGPCTTADVVGGFTCSTGTATASTNNNFFVWSTGLYGITTPTSQNAAMTASGPNYSAKTGTSMAAPHVSGVAALLISRMPMLTPDEVAFLITSSARPHPAGMYCVSTPAGTCGSGLLDATAALTRLSDRTPMLTITPSAPIVAGGQTATLTAAATPRNGGSSAFVYTWTQTAGPSVLLTNGTTATPSFTATNPGGTHSFSLVVRDGNGYRVTQNTSLRSNNAATIAPIGAASVAQGSSVTFNVTATDPEIDTLTYVATGLPAGSTFSAATGQFNWPSVTAALGTYTFNVVANDGTVNSASVTATINVSAPAAPAPAAPASSGGGGGGGSISLQQFLLLALFLGMISVMRLRHTASIKKSAR